MQCLSCVRIGADCVGVGCLRQKSADAMRHVSRWSSLDLIESGRSNGEASLRAHQMIAHTPHQSDYHKSTLNTIAAHSIRSESFFAYTPRYTLAWRLPVRSLRLHSLICSSLYRRHSQLALRSLGLAITPSLARSRARQLSRVLTDQIAGSNLAGKIS